MSELDETQIHDLPQTTDKRSLFNQFAVEASKGGLTDLSRKNTSKNTLETAFERLGCYIYEDCVVASVENINATYDNGAAGVGATLTNAGVQVPFVLNGVTLQVGDRFCVTSQTDAFQNGIYVVTSIGSLSTNWSAVRATDFNSDLKIIYAGVSYIASGSINGALYITVTSQQPYTIGTTDITFDLFALTALFATALQDALNLKIANNLSDVSDPVASRGNILAAKLGNNDDINSLEVITRGININNSPGNGNWSGRNIKWTIAAAIDKFVPAYFGNDNKTYASDAADPSKPYQFLTLESSVIGNVIIDHLVFGTIQDDSWTWTNGALIYLKDGGGLTEDITESTSQQLIGVAVNAVMIFCFPAVYVNNLEKTNLSFVDITVDGSLIASDMNKMLRFNKETTLFIVLPDVGDGIRYGMRTQFTNVGAGSVYFINSPPFSIVGPATLSPGSSGFLIYDNSGNWIVECSNNTALQTPEVDPYEGDLTFESKNLAKLNIFQSPDATPITATLPKQATLPTIVGTTLEVLNQGLGTVNFAAESGEAIVGTSALVTNKYTKIIRNTLTTWFVCGP